MTIFLILVFSFSILVFRFSVSAAEIPHIGYVYPAGGKQGTVFDITVGGNI